VVATAGVHRSAPATGRVIGEVIREGAYAIALLVAACVSGLSLSPLSVGW